MKESLKRFCAQRSFFCLVGLLGFALLASLFSPEFRTLNNWITILRQASTLIVLSSGLTAVLITGGIDLSVGATAAFVGCICAQLLKRGLSTAVVFLLGVLIGAAVGALNGFLVAVVKLPSFVATYATNSLVKGLSIIIMNGAVIYGLPEGFTNLGIGYLGPVPIIIVIAAVVIVTLYLLLQKTTWGRMIYAYGSNPNAALYAAVNVKKSVFSAFITCSITAAIGGLLMTARLNAAEAAMGDAYGLQTVAAIVVGGTSMLGGEGGVLGTAVGAILLTVIVNVMNLIGTSSLAQPMVIGVVIIAMVLLDAISVSRSETVRIRNKKEKTE